MQCVRELHTACCCASASRGFPKHTYCFRGTLTLGCFRTVFPDSYYSFGKAFFEKGKNESACPARQRNTKTVCGLGGWMLALCACAACVCVRSLCACLRVPTSFAVFQVRVHEKMKKKVIIRFFLSPSFSLFFLSSFLVPSHTSLHSFPYYFNCFHTNSTSTYPAFFSSVQQTIYPPVAQLASIHVKKNSIW